MSFWRFSSSQVSTNSSCAFQCKTKKSNIRTCSLSCKLICLSICAVFINKDYWPILTVITSTVQLFCIFHQTLFCVNPNRMKFSTCPRYVLFVRPVRCQVDAIIAIPPCRLHPRTASPKPKMESPAVFDWR